MYIKELHINHFGKFRDRTFVLEDGMNLIYGENEAGKSTLHSFIRGMLFGIEKPPGRESKEHLYSKYQPWDLAGLYGGSMDFVIEEKLYRIHRIFEKNYKSCSLIELETGRELNVQESLSQLLSGLTESSYRNTISIEQHKVKTSDELARDVRNFITNLSLTRTQEVDVSKAILFLNQKRKELLSKQVNVSIETVERAIETCFVKKAVLEQLYVQLDFIEAKEWNLKGKMGGIDLANMLKPFSSLEEYYSYEKRLPMMKEKFMLFEDIKEKQNKAKRRCDELEEELLECEQALDSLSFMKHKMNAMNQMKIEKEIKEEKKQELCLDLSEVRLKKSRMCYTFLVLMIGSVLAGFFGLNIKVFLGGIMFTMILPELVLFGILWNRLKQQEQGKKKELETVLCCLNDMQKEKEKILVQCQSSREDHMRDTYEELLVTSQAHSYLSNQWEDSRNDLLSFVQTIKLLEEELTTYLHHCHIITQIETQSMRITAQVMKDLEQYFEVHNRRIEEYMKQLRKEMEECKMEKEKVKWDIEKLADNVDELLNNQNKLSELQSEKREHQEELEAIQIAIDTIQEIATEIHYSFGNTLNRYTSEIICKITHSKYKDVIIDEKLNVKAADQNHYVPIDQLSSGTLDQMYFALRLSLAELFYPESHFPVILDDCFAYYDDTRTDATLEMLRQQKKRQVILFTCHKREEVLLEAKKERYNYIELSKMM